VENQAVQEIRFLPKNRISKTRGKPSCARNPIFAKNRISKTRGKPSCARNPIFAKKSDF